MAHRTATPLRAVGALLRALLGLSVLVALVGGVPYLLLAVGHQPTELADGIKLLEQDDGSLFLVVLTCIGWAGWAAFTFSVFLEIVALLRRRSAPRIKGLRSMQSLASFLIGGIVLLAPTAASAAAPAVAAVQTTQQATATPEAQSASSASDTTDWPRHTVTKATELPWDLAEEYLGDGKRWKDISALNPDIPQIADGDQYLPLGAVIKLPADARPIAPATSPTPSQAPDATQVPDQPPRNEPHQQPWTANGSTETHDRDRPERVTVREGDSLWSIADAHGDPNDWPAIYDANKGEPTPDGGTFDDPDLIYPGQILDLPHTDADDRSNAETAVPAPRDQGGKDKPVPTATPDTEPSKDAQADKTTLPAATPSPDRTAAPTTQGADREKAPVAAPREEAETALAPAAVWAGAGALAAALVGTLTTRRMIQQRRRRPGRRIPMPQGRAAATEQGLRSAQHPTGFDLLRTALRSLSLNLATAGRELPAIDAVVLHEAKVELHLAEDTVPMKPFSAMAGRKDLWICPASSPDLADDEQLKNADFPYPALVSIGWDGAGHLVLIDIERVGVLNLAGDPHHAQHVLQAIAVELASTPLPGHLEITTLAGAAPGLDQAAPERVVRIDDLADATAELTSHTTDQRRALAAIGATSLGAARLADDAADAWTPHILLAQDLPEDTGTAALLNDLTEEPRAAAAVITSGTTAVLPDTAWTLDCHGPDHTVVLPGSGLPIKLQGLSDEYFADAMELLVLAASDTDAPAPDWTRAQPDDPGDDQQPENSEPQPDPDTTGTAPAAKANADEDGLPPEYAELELDALADNGRRPAPAAEPREDSTSAGHAPVRSANMAKTHPQEEDTPEAEPPSRPSLADVLAADDETHAAAVPETDGTQTPDPRPTAAPAGVPPAPITPIRGIAPGIHASGPGPLPVPAGPAEPGDPAHPAPETEPSAEPAPGDSAPAVLLLGPISIEGARGRIDSSRRSVAIEIVAYLALNPGVDHHAIDDALWPGHVVNKEMRNSAISRTRSWLGKDAHGNAHLPRVLGSGDSLYRLGPAVTCDWTQFRRLARTGLASHDEDADLVLRRSLALVRGRPFTAVAPHRYAWAEPAIQEMISAIVDVAYELSTRRREAGDIPGALWAARRGLLAAEENELLHRQLFLAYHAAGDIDALREAAARLVRINEELLGGADMEAETAELLRNLLPRPVIRSHG